MIEILDIQDAKPEQKPLDITPQLMALAYNILIDGCHSFRSCKRCPVYDEQDGCLISDEQVPERWRKLEVPNESNR